jgi:hypothetical protein
MVRMNDNYLGSEIEVHLFNHSTNTISATDGELSTVRENKGQLQSGGVLVGVRFHFVLVDYCDQYEMMSMVNR